MKDSRKMKLALVQMDSLKGDVDGNLNKIEAYAKKAGEVKVDLLVFPELCTCGYYPDVFLHQQAQTAIALDDARMARLRGIARENKINMIVGAMLKSDKGYTNSAVLINAAGEILHIHDKVFLWDEEKLAFKPGKDFAVIDMPFGKLGMMICYDAGFPENARKMALKGAELIVTPAAFTHEQRHRWNIYYRSRALENTCWVAGINASGGVKPDLYFGGNVLFDPNGYQVCTGREDVEEMQVTDIDLTKADWAHKLENYIGELV